MRPDGAFSPPKRNARVTPDEARGDEALIIICGDMFAAGFDTRDMSIRLVTPESACAAALGIARERRRLEFLSLPPRSGGEGGRPEAGRVGGAAAGSVRAGSTPTHSRCFASAFSR
jgi:hypothetical protein